MAARSVGRERPMPMPPPGRWQARNVGAGEDGPALSLRSWRAAAKSLAYVRLLKNAVQRASLRLNRTPAEERW